MKYWVYINNQILGPYEKEQFSQIQGFTPESMVCPENPPDGKQEWQPAMTVMGAAAPASAPATPVPGAPLSVPLAQPAARSNVEPLSLGQFGAPTPAAQAPLSDAQASRFSSLELTVKSQAEEIRGLERKLNDFTSAIQGLQSELDALRSAPPAPQPAAAPSFTASPAPQQPMFTPAQPMVDLDAQVFPGVSADAAAPVAEQPVGSEAPASAALPAVAAPETAEAQGDKVEKKSSKKIVIILLVAIAAAGAYFAYSSGLLGGKPAPAPEPAPAPAPAVEISSNTVPAPQPAFNEEMLKLVKAYEVMPGSKTLEGVIAASAPEVSVSSIEWTIQSLDPSLYSVAVKVPPSAPDAWQISYRFDYNVVEKKLTPANTEATELLDRVKAEAAAAAAPPPPPPPAKPRKKAAKPKPAPETQAPKPQGDNVVEVIEVVEQ